VLAGQRLGRGKLVLASVSPSKFQNIDLRFSNTVAATGPSGAGRAKGKGKAKVVQDSNADGSKATAQPGFRNGFGSSFGFGSQGPAGV
jgi:hypothetical protein